MEKLLSCEVDALLWYIHSLKGVYDEGGKETVKRFGNFTSNTDDYEIICVEKLENLPECKQHEYIYEQYGDTDEQVDINAELWVFKSKEMIEYYQLLEWLKDHQHITEDECDGFYKEMTDYILRMLVNKQYHDGGFHCHLDEGIDNADDCRIDIYRYYDGSFMAFDAICGISAVFEKYKNCLKELKEKYKITEELEVNNGTTVR